MNKNRVSFRLTVKKVAEYCLFELLWGKSQQLSRRVFYPATLDRAYNSWYEAYLDFYRTLTDRQNLRGKFSSLRGRVEDSGSLPAPQIDWHKRLIEAEAILQHEFQIWLRGEQLYQIRAQIERAAKITSNNGIVRFRVVDLFVACDCPNLTRLPWETWSIANDPETSKWIRLARWTIDLATEPETIKPKRSPRARILAILGDERGLNCDADRQTLSLLDACAEIVCIRHHRDESIGAWKQRIASNIVDPRGWDLLFFAGHSRETQLTGGELGISLGTGLAIQEIATELKIARQRGLQFALFNSCEGLSIAKSLLELGLSQVIVMRQPIHDLVAQEFLQYFVRELIASKDVQDASIAACQQLQSQCRFNYPSASLIPSLFRHPHTEAFRLKQPNLKDKLRSWLPTTSEAIVLSFLIVSSLLPSVQDFLLDYRLWTQAIYRDFTGQMTQTTNSEQLSDALPPVLLVQIDPESIQRSQINHPFPMDRAYLARLIAQLQRSNTSVLGIDYLLDRQQPENDLLLDRAVRASIQQKNTWFVFATISAEIQPQLSTAIAHPLWSLQGNIKAPFFRVKLLPRGKDCVKNNCPFAYLLSLVFAYEQTTNVEEKTKPSLDSQGQLSEQLIDRLNNISTNDRLNYLHQLRSHSLTSQSNNWGQLWLAPVLDFSIPPTQIYQKLPAWQLLEVTKIEEIKIDNSRQITIIAPGGYKEAGIEPGQDNFSLPLAISYWHERFAANEGTEISAVFTGAEAHAYMIHHFLNRRLVVPLPDLWLILMAGLLGKALSLRTENYAIDKDTLEEDARKLKQKLALRAIGGTVVYIGVSSQLYISLAILIPWFLPFLAFWSYLIQVFKQNE